MKDFIPYNLVNIHVGSMADGEAVHRKILAKEVGLLSPRAKGLLSLENDEKSYNFIQTLQIASEVGVMMVADFHHERCYQKRFLSIKDKKTHLLESEKSDSVIYQHLDDIIKTYDTKTCAPLFHISSPATGWSENFKDNCEHAGLIDFDDYPHLLELEMVKRGVDYRLDIEAKDKQYAISDIEKKLKKMAK